MKDISVPYLILKVEPVIFLFALLLKSWKKYLLTYHKLLLLYNYMVP